MSSADYVSGIAPVTGNFAGYKMYRAFCPQRSYILMEETDPQIRSWHIIWLLFSAKEKIRQGKRIDFWGASDAAILTRLECFMKKVAFDKKKNLKEWRSEALVYEG